jgi:hypothetical protein
LINCSSKGATITTKVLAEFDEALSRAAGLPQPMAGPFVLENAQTGERLTVRVETECSEDFTSKVSNQKRKKFFGKF